MRKTDKDLVKMPILTYGEVMKLANIIHSNNDSESKSGNR